MDWQERAFFHNAVCELMYVGIDIHINVEYISVFIRNKIKRQY